MRSGWGDFGWELVLLSFIQLVLALIAISSNALQFLALIAFAINAAIIVRRYHLFASVSCLFLVILVLYLTTFDFFNVLSIMLKPGLIGLAMGLLFKNHVQPGRSLLILMVISFIVTAGFLAGAYLVESTNPFTMGRGSFVGIEEASEFYRETGLLSAEEEKQVQEQVKGVVDLFVILLPGSIIIWSMVLTFISYLLAIKVFGRMGYNAKEIPPYRTWSLPWQVIWGAIAGLVLFMAGQEWNIEWISNAGMNLLYVFSFLFIVAGISVFIYFIKIWKAKKIFKVIIIILILIYWPLGGGLVLGLGLLDSVVNLRKFGVKNK